MPCWITSARSAGKLTGRCPEAFDHPLYLFGAEQGDYVNNRRKTRLSDTMCRQPLHGETQRRTKFSGPLIHRICNLNTKECSCSAFSTSAGPPSLDPVSSWLHSNVTTVCLQGTWFYTKIFDTRNALYMSCGPWVLYCCFIRLRRLSASHLTGEVDLLSSQSQLLDGQMCFPQVGHPGCAENQKTNRMTVHLCQNEKC